MASSKAAWRTLHTSISAPVRVTQRYGSSRCLTTLTSNSRRLPIVTIRCSLQTQSQYSRSYVQARYESSSAAQSKLDTNAAPESKIYSYEDINKLSTSPSSKRILIDVREPAELQSTGYIPGAKNMPINSSPEALFLPAEDFEDKFGWEKPKSNDELVFYCKAGVRSRTAAGMAKMAGWQSIGEYPGSWVDWVEKGGKIER